jgi:hypothetical protein
MTISSRVFSDCATMSLFKFSFEIVNLTNPFLFDYNYISKNFLIYLGVLGFWGDRKSVV